MPLKRLVDPERPVTYGIVQAGPHVVGGVPYIRPADMTEEDGISSADDLLRTSPEIAGSYSRSTVRTGDLVCSIGPSFGKVMVIPKSLEGANLTQGTARIACQAPHSARYLFWALRSPTSAAQWESSVGGATFRALNLGPLCETVLAVPSPEEQHLIAQFLDAETAKIDALVASQQRLITLLLEKRQAVISHSVTEGLNRDARMKSSDIAWIGLIPEHWEVLRGAAIGTLFGSEQVPDEDIRDKGALPFIKVGSLSLDSFEIESWDWFVDERVAHQYRARANYITFPKRGAAIFTNKVNIVDRPSLIDPNLMGWEIGGKALPKFIAYVLKMRRLEELADVSTIPQINNKHIAPERFPIPPIAEQLEIVNFLDCQSRRIASLIVAARQAIVLLQERRSALISAAVTGKIDVRNYTAMLAT
jgi:type I restriction enzyme, S subunit